MPNNVDKRLDNETDTEQRSETADINAMLTKACRAFWHSLAC